MTAQDNRPKRPGVAPRNPHDQVIVSPAVLLTIARLSTLQVEGVARMDEVPGGVNRLVRRTPASEGVQIMIEGQKVTVDLFIVAYASHNIREVSNEVQRRVGRAIREIVGMQVSAINVHIGDVEFDAAGKDSA